MIASLRSLWARLSAAAATDDPLQQAGARIALFAGSGQPLYPLGLVWIIGDAGWVARVAWLTTPFFLLVPFLGRWPVAGRLLLGLAGTFVTLYVALALGPASAVEAYHLPVLLVGLLLFCKEERLAQIMTLAMPLGALVWVRLAAPMGVESAGQLALIHWVGALGLSAYIVFVSYSARKHGRGRIATGQGFG
jgi:hypothetical protein